MNVFIIGKKTMSKNNFSTGLHRIAGHREVERLPVRPPQRAVPWGRVEQVLRQEQLAGGEEADRGENPG